MKTGSGPVSHRQFHISIKVVGANHARAAEPGAGAKTRLRMPPQNGGRSSSEHGMWRMPANDANLRELNPGRSLDSLPHQLTNSPTHQLTNSPLTTHHSPLTSSPAHQLTSSPLTSSPLTSSPLTSSLLTTHYSLLTTHYSLLTTHYSLLAARRSPLAARRSQLATTSSAVCLVSSMSIPAQEPGWFARPSLGCHRGCRGCNCCGVR
jgi:hypothetical protein